MHNQGTTFYTDKCQGAQHVKKDEHSDHVSKCLSLVHISFLKLKQTMACSGDFDAAGSDFVNSLDAYCKKSNNQTKKIMCKALVAVAVCLSCANRNSLDAHALLA